MDGGGDAAAPNNKVRVVVRVRPENSLECEANKGIVVHPLNEKVLVFDPKQESSPDFYKGKKRKCRDMLKRKQKDLQLSFDHVFDSDTTNADVYEHTTRSVLDSLMEGYNCSVFAYGATGAGKTFTMLGSASCPGVIFLTVMDLYRKIDEMKDDKTCDVAVSYLEVYNEQIRDLLMPTGYLPIREDPQKGVTVAGLSLHKPGSAEELMKMLEFGNHNRTQHPTDANAESSRSHAVFQVFVRQRDRTAGLSTDVMVSKMCLIDLAGSERATVTKNRGARFREGANINRSLLALGNCINALADGKKSGFVPYRNSKLTRLLKDSLGGNCNTVMIAAVSPSFLSYEDTYNTLRYASRAKNIRSDLKQNVVSVDFHIAQYAKIVQELRQEVLELKSKVKQYEEDSVAKQSAPSSRSAMCPSQQADINRLLGALSDVFSDRKGIRREILDIEGTDRDLSFKVSCKDRIIAHTNILFSDQSLLSKVQSRLQKSNANSRRRQAGLAEQREKAQEKMSTNNDRLKGLETELQPLGASGQLVAQVMQATIRSHHQDIELHDTKRHVRHLKRICGAQQRTLQSNDRVMCQMLTLLRKQHYIIKGHGLVTSDLQQEFDEIQRSIAGEVTWAELDDGPKNSNWFKQMTDFPVLTCHLTKPACGPSTESFSNNENAGDSCPNSTCKTESVAAMRQLTPKKHAAPDAGHTPHRGGTIAVETESLPSSPNVADEVDSATPVINKIAPPTISSVSAQKFCFGGNRAENNNSSESDEGQAKSRNGLAKKSFLSSTSKSFENIASRVDSGIVLGKNRDNCSTATNNKDLPGTGTKIRNNSGGTVTKVRDNVATLTNGNDNTTAVTNNRGTASNNGVAGRTVLTVNKNVTLLKASKSSFPFNFKSNTIAKLASRPPVDSGTVIKNKEAPGTDTEFGKHVKVKRSITFGGTTNGENTDRASCSDESPQSLDLCTRSPLARRDTNTCSSSSSNGPGRSFKRPFSMLAPKETSQVPDAKKKRLLSRSASVCDAQVSETLNRLGLPSMVEGLRWSAQKPGYMKPTRVVARRQRKLRRSIDNQDDRRLSMAAGSQTEKKFKPSSIARTQTFTNLHSKSTAL